MKAHILRIFQLQGGQHLSSQLPDYWLLQPRKVFADIAEIQNEAKESKDSTKCVFTFDVGLGLLIWIFLPIFNKTSLPNEQQFIVTNPVSAHSLCGCYSKDSVRISKN